MEYTIKRFGSGLHIIVPKSKFKEEQRVHINENDDSTEKIRRIVKEEIEAIQRY